MSTKNPDFTAKPPGGLVLMWIFQERTENAVVVGLCSVWLFGLCIPFQCCSSAAVACQLPSIISFKAFVRIIQISFIYIFLFNNLHFILVFPNNILLLKGNLANNYHLPANLESLDICLHKYNFFIMLYNLDLTDCFLTSRKL